MSYNTPQKSISSLSLAIRGFSLIEVMIVVVIIGLLAGAVALKVGDYVDKARINRAKSDIATIVSAVEAFYAEKGRYPRAEEGIDALSLKHAKDPWGQPYIYENLGEAGFEIICLGADGVEGGTGINTDITDSMLTTQESL